MTLDSAQSGKPLPSWTGVPLPEHLPLVGQYCSLEPFDTEGHADKLYAEFCSSGDETWTYLSDGPFATLEEFIRLYRKASQAGGQFYVVIDHTTSSPVGWLAYYDMSSIHGRIELAYVTFSKRMQRSRLGTETIYLMLKNAFSLGYRRCSWTCHSRNAQSIKTAQRIGFKHEGTFRNHMVAKKFSRDTYWFAMTDEDWAQRKQALEGWLHPSNFDVAGQQKETLK